MDRLLPSFYRIGRYFLWLFVCLMVSLNDLQAGQLLQAPSSFRYIDLGPVPPIQTIFQDRQGFIWLGHDGGLLRYDGYALKSYDYSPNDSTTLSSNVIYYLFQENERYLWAASGHGGVNRIDLFTDRVTRFLHDPNDSTSIDSDFTRMMFRGNSGTLWFFTDRGFNRLMQDSAGHGSQFRRMALQAPLSWDQLTPHLHDEMQTENLFTLDGIYLFDPMDEKLYPLLPPANLPDGKEFRPVTGTARGQRLWLADAKGHIVLLQQGRRSVQWLLPGKDFPAPDDLQIKQLDIDDRGGLWIFTFGQGVLQVDSTLKHTIQYAGQAALHGDRISSQLMDRDGRLWVATQLGLNLLEERERLFEVVLPFPDSILDNRVGCLYSDRNGTIWVSANRRLHLFHPDKNRFDYDLHLKFREQGFPENTLVKTILEDSNGNIWLGTLNQEVFRYSPATGRLQHIILPGGKEKLIRSILEDSRGYMWFGVDWPDGGLFRMDPASGRFTVYRHDPANPVSLGSNSVWDALEDSRGRFWVSLWGGGLDLFDPATGVFLHFRHDSGDSNSISSNQVTDLLELPDGSLWAGTWNGGLNRIVTDKNGNIHFRRYTSREGFSSDNQVAALLADKDGLLWMSTGQGISRFDPVSGRFRHFTLSDGIQSQQFAASAVARTPAGELFFGGTNGFNRLRTHRIQQASRPPEVIFTSFKIFEEEVLLDTLITYKNHLSIPFKNNFISFEFAAMHFSDPTLFNFQYRLDGFYDDWTTSGIRRFVSFSHLDPGNYTFRVRASNRDGLWIGEGAHLRITILPPWWRTWWAYLLYAVLLTGVIAAGRWVVLNWKSIISIRARKISHFKLQESLGSGGMGEVFRALDLNTRQTVALKLLHQELLKDPENRRRFANEGRLLASFSHPHIVQVVEVGETVNQGYIAMEYLTGGTLKEYIEKNHPLPLAEILRIVLQVADGLKEIHRQNIVHRDIKAGNIMLDEQGDLRIMDFGLSKSHLVTTMTTLGTVIGTLGYVAPEQVTGISVDHRVDIFSFGVLLYELITGSMPFTGENEMALIHSIFSTEPPPPSSLRPDIGSGWDRVVDICLKKKPEERFASTSDVMKSINEI